MKKLLWLLAIVLMFCIANAQTTKTGQKKDMPKTEQKSMKMHKDTAACMKAHGKKGHKCTKECAKQNAKEVKKEKK
jgi:hypothetical protein